MKFFVVDTKSKLHFNFFSKSRCQMLSFDYTFEIFKNLCWIMGRAKTGWSRLQIPEYSLLRYIDVDHANISKCLLHMYVNLIRSLNLEICLKLQPCSWPPDVWTLIIESLAKMSRGQLTIWMLIKFKCHHLLLWGLHNTLRFDEKSGFWIIS